MKSRLTLASLATAAALIALPTSSQAGDLGRMHDCLFGWMKHVHHAAPAKVEKKKAVKKAKKAKKVAAMPKK